MRGKQLRVDTNVNTVRQTAFAITKVSPVSANRTENLPLIGKIQYCQTTVNKAFGQLLIGKTSLQQAYGNRFDSGPCSRLLDVK